jgi:hypothetical protein
VHFIQNVKAQTSFQALTPKDQVRCFILLIFALKSRVIVPVNQQSFLLLYRQSHEQYFLAHTFMLKELFAIFFNRN